MIRIIIVIRKNGCIHCREFESIYHNTYIANMRLFYTVYVRISHVWWLKASGPFIHLVSVLEGRGPIKSAIDHAQQSKSARAWLEPCKQSRGIYIRNYYGKHDKTCIKGTNLTFCCHGEASQWCSCYLLWWCVVTSYTSRRGLKTSMPTHQHSHKLKINKRENKATSKKQNENSMNLVTTKSNPRCSWWMIILGFTWASRHGLSGKSE